MLKLITFLTAVLSVVSRGPSNGEHNATALTSGINIPIGNSTLEENIVQVDPLQNQQQDSECNPFCVVEEHPVSDEVQISVLLNNSHLMRTFYQKKMPQRIPYSVSDTAVLRDEDQYMPLCNSIKREYKPKAAKDVYGVKHFLLNPDGGSYQQLVETEDCEANDKPCPALKEYTRPNQTTTCRTHYFTIGLTAIDQNTLEPYEIVAKIPSGCNCFVQHSLSNNDAIHNP